MTKDKYLNKFGDVWKGGEKKIEKCKICDYKFELSSRQVDGHIRYHHGYRYFEEYFKDHVMKRTFHLSEIEI